MQIKFLRLTILLVMLFAKLQCSIADDRSANSAMNAAIFSYHSDKISIDELTNRLRLNHTAVSDLNLRAYWDDILQRAIGTQFVLSQPKPDEYIHLLVWELRQMAVRDPLGPRRLDVFVSDRSLDAARLAGIDIPWERYSPARKLVDIGEHAIPILKQFRSDKTLTKIIILPKRGDGVYGLATVAQTVDAIIEAIRERPPAVDLTKAIANGMSNTNTPTLMPVGAEALLDRNEAKNAIRPNGDSK